MEISPSLLRRSSVDDEEVDGDGDGQAPCGGDCDDTNDTVYEGAEELCDGLDTTCDGELDADEADVDGDLILGCDGDCDDENAEANPDQAENTEVTCDDGFDNDCDELADYDDPDCEEFEPRDREDEACNCSATSTRGDANVALLLLGLLGLVRRRRT